MISSLSRGALVDFFSGCGGTSLGFSQAGIEPIAAIDIDEDAISTYRLNFPNAETMRRDIREIDVEDLKGATRNLNGRHLIFAACAPCQPFSRQRHGSDADDSRAMLSSELVRFVFRWQPSVVFVENVPGLEKRPDGRRAFARLLDAFERLGYTVRYRTVEARSYGVPQRRRRLVLIASRLGPIEIPRSSHGPGLRAYTTVREAIQHYPAIDAGEEDSEIPNHRAARLSALNLVRIRATPQGGDHRSWPRTLVNDCHVRAASAHVDSYGRLAWDAPTGAMTTRCISYSNGKYGHPEQDRAISIREAAALQTFPDDFVFVGSLNSAARQVGNAVPVLLAKALGEQIAAHLSIAVESRKLS